MGLIFMVGVLGTVGHCLRVDHSMHKVITQHTLCSNVVKIFYQFYSYQPAFQTNNKRTYLTLVNKAPFDLIIFVQCTSTKLKNFPSIIYQTKMRFSSFGNMLETFIQFWFLSQQINKFWKRYLAFFQTF